MKCWFCEKEARGICIVCGRAVCHEHGYKLDQFTHAKSDTSTGVATYFKALCWFETPINGFAKVFTFIIDFSSSRT